MGDVAMTVPVIDVLRKSYPDAQIVVLTNAFFRPFFRDVDNIEFFTPDLKGRHKGLGGLWRLASDVWEKFGGFDFVADLHDVLRSKVLRRLMRLKGAKIAVIDKGRAEKKKLTSLKHKLLVRLKPTVERYRDVFAELGFELSEPLSKVRPLSERQPVMLTAAAETLTGKKDKIWIGIAPFAQHAGKIYPLDLMEQVIGALSQYSSLKMFVFGGGASEKAFAEQLENKFSGVVSVIGKVSLNEELDIISNLDLMVTMDSSAMHMASLVGTPVVSIWGATHPFAGFYGFGQDDADAVQIDELKCRPCSIYGNKPCAIGGYPCMNMIQPGTIVAKVVSKLGIAENR